MLVPEWLQTLRKLRPTHVVQALSGDSPLLLLNPRDLRRADAEPIARIGVASALLISPLLRAARDGNALIGIQLAGVQDEGRSAGRFAAAVVRAAEEAGFSTPLFLATASIPLGAGADAGERLHAQVQRHLDAAFTEVVLACPDQIPEGLVDALEIGLAGVRELELPVSLSAANADQAAPILEEMRRAGFEPDLLILESPSGAGALGAEAVELPFDAMRPGLRGIDISRPLASFASGMDDASEPAAQARTEALVYAEAFRILGAAPFRGSAARAMRALAASPGY
jgi:hypothetical protein